MESSSSGEEDEFSRPAEFFTALRQDYRNFIEETRVHQDELINADASRLEQALELVDSYQERVTRPQEATLDSTAFLRLSSIALEQVKSVNVSAGTFKPELFVSQLLARLASGVIGQKRRSPSRTPADHDMASLNEANDVDDVDYAAEGCNWRLLGSLATKAQRIIPQPGFLYGPLEAQRKERSLRERSQQPRPVKAAQPEELPAGDVVKEELTMAHCVKTAFQILQANAPINLYRFFINPTDYAQSVENLFYTSFLVNDDRVRIYVDPQTQEPMVDLVYDDDSGDEQGSARNHASASPAQCIVNLTMDIWERAKTRYRLTDALIPSRPVPRDVSEHSGWYS